MERERELGRGGEEEESGAALSSKLHLPKNIVFIHPSLPPSLPPLPSLRHRQARHQPSFAPQCFPSDRHSRAIIFIHPFSLPPSLPPLPQGIAKLSINRPSLRNAFRPTTIRELKRCMALAQDDLQVGVIILTGRKGGEGREGGREGREHSATRSVPPPFGSCSVVWHWPRMICNWVRLY